MLRAYNLDSYECEHLPLLFLAEFIFFFLLLLLQPLCELTSKQADRCMYSARNPVQWNLQKSRCWPASSASQVWAERLQHSPYAWTEFELGIKEDWVPHRAEHTLPTSSACETSSVAFINSRLQ